MPRKTEQEIELDEQIRFLKTEQRKCRTSSGRLKIADRLLKLYAMRFPSPINEAVAVAKAAKLKIKADKLVVDQAKEVQVERKPSEWLERPNPVEEQARRAEVRTKMREDRAEDSTPIEHVTATEPVVELAPDWGDAVVELAPDWGDAVVETEPSDAPTLPTAIPEMAAITREAEAEALRQSTGWGDLKRIMQPLEPRDGMEAVVRSQHSYTHEGCDFDPIRQEVAPSLEQQGWEQGQDAMGVREWRRVKREE